MKSVERREVLLDGTSLRVEDVELISEGPESCDVSVPDEARARMKRSRDVVESWVSQDRVIYGVTTGFGEFANVSIGRDQLEALQANLIRSHAVGAGDPMPVEMIRGMLALRINALARGFSGIRPETVDTLLNMLRHDILPFVPEQGSVGSSGDLVPLAHIALGAMGEGEVWEGKGLRPAAEVLAEKGIEPVVLRAKEGLALINGTQMMTSYGSLALVRLKRLLRVADVVAALSVEALRGTDRAYHPLLHAARPHPGQIQVASNLRTLMEGSGIRESHRNDDDRVQDAYSIRCIPQVHGACRDAVEYIDRALAIEINSATDNPLIFPEDDEYIEGGNFHGEPVALPLDMIAIAASELANISERRTERMVNGSLSRLPRFLTEKGGLNSGLMIAQYTAAAIVSENKVLAHPASVDSIPTSANQEDHNSMGSIAARKGWQVVRNLESVLAVEYLCACQGIDFLAPLKLSPTLEPVYQALRDEVPHLEGDRVLYDDLKIARRLISEAIPYHLVRESLGDDC